MRFSQRAKKLAQWLRSRRSNDGTDGPSKFTNAAVSPALDLTND